LGSEYFRGRAEAELGVVEEEAFIEEVRSGVEVVVGREDETALFRECSQQVGE
jgi:hypothetical protein